MDEMISFQCETGWYFAKMKGFSPEEAEVKVIPMGGTPKSQKDTFNLAVVAELNGEWERPAFQTVLRANVPVGSYHDRIRQVAALFVPWLKSCGLCPISGTGVH